MIGLITADTKAKVFLVEGFIKLNYDTFIKLIKAYHIPHGDQWKILIIDFPL